MNSNMLGRKKSVDARDLNHLMAHKLEAGLVRPKSMQWSLRWHGDQGQTSMCVGFGFYGLLRAKPKLQYDPQPKLIYEGAQKNDEWPGEAYDGTSVRGGAKFLQSVNKLSSYAWAFDVNTVLNWIGSKGPVVLGTDWTNQMFTPDVNGLVTVGDLNNPTNIAGGHCYVAIGYNDKTRLVTLQNSWGKSWGIKGRFYMTYADVDALIKNQGEACTPVE